MRVVLDWIPACAGMTTWERKSADEDPQAATPNSVNEIMNIYRNDGEGHGGGGGRPRGWRQGRVGGIA